MLFDEYTAQHSTARHTAHHITKCEPSVYVLCSTLSSSLEFNFSNMSAFISILFCFALAAVGAAATTVAIVIIDVAVADDDARK